jgi:hypothetical protein
MPPAQIIRAGGRLSVRLPRTSPDCYELHGMQKVRGFESLSSTPGQRPVPISEAGLFHTCTAAKYSCRTALTGSGPVMSP